MIPPCTLYKLKKGQPRHLNNCIYHFRWKPEQIALFAGEKKKGYDVDPGRSPETTYRSNKNEQKRNPGRGTGRGSE